MTGATWSSTTWNVLSMTRRPAFTCRSIWSVTAFIASSPSVNNLVIRGQRIERGSDPKRRSPPEDKGQGEGCLYEACDGQRLDASCRSQHTFCRPQTAQCDSCG